MALARLMIACAVESDSQDRPISFLEPPVEMTRKEKNIQ